MSRTLECIACENYKDKYVKHAQYQRFSISVLSFKRGINDHSQRFIKANKAKV